MTDTFSSVRIVSTRASRHERAVCSTLSSCSDVDDALSLNNVSSYVGAWLPLLGAFGTPVVTDYASLVKNMRKLLLFQACWSHFLISSSLAARISLDSLLKTIPRISKIVGLAGSTLKHTLVLIVGNEPVREESPQGQVVQMNNP